MRDQDHIRNFCIIAHIDHGKSTLADRLIEQTGTISRRAMVAQTLDSMDLERERGVTIKASAVRMSYRGPDGDFYELNLIDTPGHVDFTYEVSRALAACEGALLVVDATQGVEAQTLANLYLALDADLEIVPVVNKIDLPAARPDEVAVEITDLLGGDPDSVLRVSAKEGIGTDAVLEAVVRQMPAPAGDAAAPFRALVFDSHYDSYKGVVAYVRVVDGATGSPAGMAADSRPGESGEPAPRVRAPKPAAPPRMHLVAAGVAFDPLEVGVFAPDLKPCLGLSAGDVGYVATGLKTVRQVRVGDTLALAEGESVTALPGYNAAKPMVFAGVYPIVSDDYEDLRDALDKLRLNDAALSVEPESSVALGHGFRVGFLGLFHMEIVQERLEREYGLNLLTTAPSVVYELALRGGGTISVDNPAAFPDPSTIEEIREPWMLVTIWSPDEYIGPIMDLVTSRRGVFDKMEYVAPSRVMITYHMPLADIITEFYDHLKSRTRGYASMDYHLDGLRAGDLVRVDILVNDTPVDALSLISHAEDAHRVGDAMTRRLKSVIPRQQFKVPIQAAIGRRIIARQTVAAMRKDVLAKCYGGDVSRKRKLLEQQRAGKKRMKRMGNVEIPQEAFMAVLKLGGDGKTK